MRRLLLAFSWPTLTEEGLVFLSLPSDLEMVLTHYEFLDLSSTVVVAYGVFLNVE